MITVALVGVALAFPAGLNIAANNLARLGNLGGGIQISLFLLPTVDESQAKSIATRLESRTEVATVDVIGRSAALQEYTRLSGLGDLATLFGDENPLPVVLVVHPRGNPPRAETVRSLAAELTAMPEVEASQTDLEWIERLAAWMTVVETGLWLLGALLGGGVLLVVGNVIRLAAQGRREEIAVARLCGATDSFIRRPFLYAGLSYGLMGGAMALALVWLALVGFSEPVQRLSNLYLAEFTLQGPAPADMLLLLVTSASLGLASAWWAISRLLSVMDA